MRRLIFVFFLLVTPVQAQTLIGQGGVSVSRGIGDKPAGVIEGRLQSKWALARGAVAFEKKSYLDSGRVITGDLLGRWKGRELWAGAGIELAHVRTITYEKTARRLLIGGGIERESFALAGYGFPSEFGTPNKSFGFRADLDIAHGPFILTLRPYWIHYHDSIYPKILRSGEGVDLLFGLRWHLRR